MEEQRNVVQGEVVAHAPAQEEMYGQRLPHRAESAGWSMSQ
jgi:hypothetical protein